MRNVCIYRYLIRIYLRDTQLFYQSFFFFNNSLKLHIFSYVIVARNGRYRITNVLQYILQTFEYTSQIYPYQNQKISLATK